MRNSAFVAFFLSGASSLIFQNIWARMLHHVFGSTSVAISTVVTAFMAGLGIGAFLAGRIADRLRHPLLYYAGVEIAVGLWALLVPTLVDPEGFLSSLNLFLRSELGADSFGFMIGRFACVLPILIVPTTLMGATLPLLTRHLLNTEAGVGSIGARVGSLYAVNTFGAVAGVVLAGFVFMPSFGVHATNLLAVSLNLALGFGIFVFRRTLSKPSARIRRVEAESDDATNDPGADLGSFGRGAAFAAFAISGAAALCYEVTWTRALAMTLGPSIYSFALILATFLVGIAGGSAIASAALVSQERRLRAALAATLPMCALGAAPFGIAHGLGAWGLICAVSGSVSLTTYVIARGRLGAPAPPPITGPVIVMLAAPLLIGVAGKIATDGSLASLTLAVTLALACFVAVVTLGTRTPLLQLAGVQLFVAGGTLLNFLFQDRIPCTFAGLVAGVGDLSAQVGAVQFFMFLTAALCTLPATLGMGAMFPLTFRVWTSGRPRAARDVGLLYAGNTAGSIVGAWLPGFVLLPLIGLQTTLLAGIAVNLLLALLLLVARASEARRIGTPLPIPSAVLVYVGGPLVPAAIVALVLLGVRRDAPLRWNLAQMTLGVFRLSISEDVCKSDRGAPEIVFYKDGLSTTVSVERWGDHLALKNNGKVDASNGDDMPTQIMVTAYPMLLHPRAGSPLDVAVVGFGSGVSVGTALRFPVRKVDAIELEDAVVDGSRFFAEASGLAYPHARFPYVEAEGLRVHDDDGRNFLASTRERYDVIVSEPSNPWITGVSDLFTVEHFRTTKRRLRPGGIYCQWVQLYELSPENIKSIYRTFAEQFEHVVVFAADSYSSDTILIGSDAPLSFDLRHLERSLASPAIRGELDRAGIASAYDLLGRVLLASKEEVLSYARIEMRRRGGRWVPLPESFNGPDEPCRSDCRRISAPLNTDDNARIEFAAPKDLIGFERYEGYLGQVYGLEWPYGKLLGAIGGIESSAAHHAQMAIALLRAGRKGEAARFLERSRALGPNDDAVLASEILTLLLDDHLGPAVPIEPPSIGEALASRETRLLEAGFSAVRKAVDAGSLETALAALELIPSPLRRASGPGLRLLHGYLLYQTHRAETGRKRRAIETLEDLIASEPDVGATHPAVHYVLGRLYDADLEPAKAFEQMHAFLEARRNLERRAVEAGPAGSLRSELRTE